MSGIPVPAPVPVFCLLISQMKHFSKDNCMGSIGHPVLLIHMLLLWDYKYNKEIHSLILDKFMFCLYV